MSTSHHFSSLTRAVPPRQVTDCVMGTSFIRLQKPGRVILCNIMFVCFFCKMDDFSENWLRVALVTVTLDIDLFRHNSSHLTEGRPCVDTSLYRPLSHTGCKSKENFNYQAAKFY